VRQELLDVKLLVIDNYDSFTWNLVQYLGELGACCEVVRNDAIPVEAIDERAPHAIVISPGPCTPREAGISVAAIERCGATIPILGVCLGHQAIGAAYGAEVVPARALMHGKTSEIRHCGQRLFAGLPQPFTATRYHSLAVRRASLPSVLCVTAEAEDGEIMGLEHREHPVFGVQFHPESILTAAGKDLLRNFLELAAAARPPGAGPRGSAERGPSSGEDSAARQARSEPQASEGGWRSTAREPGPAEEGS
jgi:anthranilate synthase/aminodeoxychorismate synthase-like glutamine amidotransferase